MPEYLGSCGATLPTGHRKDHLQRRARSSESLPLCDAYERCVMCIGNRPITDKAPPH